MEMLKKFFIWLASIFGVKVPDQLPDPSFPPLNPPAPQPTNPVPPPASTPKRRYFRIVKTGKVDNDGINQLALQLCESIDGKKFRVVEAISCRSGLAFHQFFRVASESMGGSHEPLPEGYWDLEEIEWAGAVGDYEARFESGIGPFGVRLTPRMKTGRSDIYIHWDLGVPGTNGCCGILSLAECKIFVSWLKDPELAPKSLTSNYGLGTVETWLNSPDPSPVDDSGMPKVDRDMTNVCTSREIGRAGAKVDMGVLHNTECTLQQAIDRFMTKSEEVSAHLIVDRDGSTTKMVNFTDTAWHSGNKPINHRSIGMEIVAGGSVGKGMTPVQEAKVIAWWKWIFKTYGVKIDDLIPHRKAVATSCPGSIWKTDAELEAWKKKNLV